MLNLFIDYKLDNSQHSFVFIHLISFCFFLMSFVAWPASLGNWLPGDRIHTLLYVNKSRVGWGGLQSAWLENLKGRVLDNHVYRTEWLTRRDEEGWGGDDWIAIGALGGVSRRIIFLSFICSLPSNHTWMCCVRHCTANWEKLS